MTLIPFSLLLITSVSTRSCNLFLFLLCCKWAGWTEVQCNHGKSHKIPELFAIWLQNCFNHQWSRRRAVWVGHCQLPHGKLPRGKTLVYLKNAASQTGLSYGSHRLTFYIIFAEKPVEHIYSPRRGEDCRVHGPRWSINTDRLCGRGWSQGPWLHAYQTVWLFLQCVHTQFPLLWQKWGW